VNTGSAEDVRAPVSLPKSQKQVVVPPEVGGVPQEPRRHEPTTQLLETDSFSGVIVRDNCDFRGYLLPRGQTISAKYKPVSLVDYPLDYTTRLYMQPDGESPLGVQGQFKPSSFILKPKDSQILTLTLTAAKDAKDTLARIAPDTGWRMMNGSRMAGGSGWQHFIAVGEGKSFPIDYFYSMKLVDDSEAIDKEPVGIVPRGEEATVIMKAGETREVRWSMKISYAKRDPIELNPTAKVLNVNQYANNKLPDGVAINFTTSTPKIVQNEDFDLVMRISVGKSAQITSMRILVTPLGPIKPPLPGNIGPCREEPFHTILNITVKDG